MHAGHAPRPFLLATFYATSMRRLLPLLNSRRAILSDRFYFHSRFEQLSTSFLLTSQIGNADRDERGLFFLSFFSFCRRQKIRFDFSRDSPFEDFSLIYLFHSLLFFISIRFNRKYSYLRDTIISKKNIRL